MTQQTELEKVKARIRLFLDRTVENGCTEAEAMEAMGRVGSLMKQYNLTMSEVELRKTEMVTVKTKIYGRKRRPLDTCIVSLASFCECKVWNSKSKAGNYYSFFGHETDAQLAVYLYDVISAAYETEAEKFKRTDAYDLSLNRREALRSFGVGMSTRLHKRFIAMVAEREAEQRRQRTDATSSIGALVVLKQSLVEAALSEMNLKLTKSRKNKGAKSSTGYNHGFAAGGNVNLNRPVGSTGGASTYLS